MNIFFRANIRKRNSSAKKWHSNQSKQSGNIDTLRRLRFMCRHRIGGVFSCEQVVETKVKLFEEKNEFGRGIQAFDAVYWTHLLSIFPTHPYDHSKFTRTESVNGWKTKKLCGIEKKAFSFVEIGKKDEPFVVFRVPLLSNALLPVCGKMNLNG